MSTETGIQEAPVLRTTGYCPICGEERVFSSTHMWLRDHFFCEGCHSIPRNRALIYALERYLPNWRLLRIHEAGPGGSASVYVQHQCPAYSASHLLPDVPAGEFCSRRKVWSQNLHALTFADATFDVVITQDVLEHVLRPREAFAEIARVLAPGGMHIFTVPWYADEACSRYRAVEENGIIRHLAPAQYHGNPVSADGSLVTVDYGRDLMQIIFEASGMHTLVYLERDRNLGLDGEFLEVFISIKPNPEGRI